jgi:hypothetical protein
MSANVYKSVNLEDLKNKTVKPVSSSDKVKVAQTITNFILYLKRAHS